MPIDLTKRQTIEEITGGRIKKKPREEAAPPAGRAKGAVRPEVVRKTGKQ